MATSLEVVEDGQTLYSYILPRERNFKRSPSAKTPSHLACATDANFSQDLSS